MEIKRAFAKLFPNRKLIDAFRNSRGKTHLEVDSTERADDIEQKWKTSAWGQTRAYLIVKADTKKMQYSSRA